MRTRPVSERFADAGWQGVGVDISPAAIDYAGPPRGRGTAGLLVRSGGLSDAEVYGDFDLVLCLFGELSTLPLDDVRNVLSGASRRLRHGGRVVVELSTYRGVTGKGRRPVSWYTANGGLFAEGRHLVLRESQSVRSRERLGRTVVGHRWDGVASSVTRHDDVVASDDRG